MSQDFIQINKHYHQDSLTKVDSDPLLQFSVWFDRACEVMPRQLVNAMTVATVSADGRPSTRVVLLKQYDEQGFVFFTNFHSRKGQQLKANPHVALLFWWEALDQQVRVEGCAEKISDTLSDEYFQTRARLSKIAATVSPQSAVIDTMTQLTEASLQLQQQYVEEDAIVPRPDNWGGYIVKPELFEFWQGGEHRLHDRFQYRLLANNRWKIERLAP